LKNSTRNLAIVLLFFNGISALFGGGSMIYDPSGQDLQMPIELLDTSPFDNFLIPGIILFSFNGLLNLIVGVLGIRKNHLFPNLTLLCGLLLTAWLTIQIILIKEFYAPLHITYYLVGIALIILGLKMRMNNRSA
jgi:hypothetical protein